MGASSRAQTATFHIPTLVSIFHIRLLPIFCLFLCACQPQSTESTNLTGDNGQERLKAIETSPSSPIVELQPSILRLGDLQISEPAEREFQLTNLSGTRIQITSLTTSCGCTVPSIPVRELGPGQSTPIVVTMHPSKPGPEGAILRIVLDGGDSSISGRIEWNTITDLSVTPHLVQFGQVLVNTKHSVSLDINVSNERQLSDVLDRVSTKPSEILVVSQNGSSLDLVLTAEDKNVKGTGSVILHCKNPVRQITIPVTWETVAPVSSVPSGLFLGSIISGSVVKKQFLVRSHEQNIQNVDLECSALSPLEGIEFDTELLYDKTWRCVLNIVAPKVAGPFNCSVPLIVTTADRNQSQLFLSISGLVVGDPEVAPSPDSEDKCVEEM